MARVTVRLTDRMAAQLGAAAHKQGVPPARFVRQLIGQAVASEPVSSPEAPTETELIALLSEKARHGNVAAIRSLLAREHVTDPRARAMELFAQMVQERRQ